MEETARSTEGEQVSFVSDDTQIRRISYDAAISVVKMAELMMRT